MTDEEFVRKNWNGARYDGHRVLSDHSIKGATWILSGNSNCQFEYSNHLDESTAWSRAAEFTRDRLEQIRQIEREMSELLAFCGTEEDWVRWCVDGPYVPSTEVSSLIRNYITRSRTLAARKAALSELKKGMK